MKFFIKSNDKIGEQELIYLDDECSFYSGVKHATNMELIVNKISLTVFNDRIANEDRAVDVSGFCGFDKSMKSNCEVPEYKKGILKVEHDLEYGFGYRINDIELPVRVNMKTGALKRTRLELTPNISQAMACVSDGNCCGTYLQS